MTKKGILAIGFLALAIACNRTGERSGEQSGTETARDRSSDTVQPAPLPSGERYASSTEMLWDYQFDTLSHEYLPIKMRQVNADTLSVEKIETLINRTWPEVQVELLKASGDTVFIAIPDSEALTQQMGSAGATQFIVSATYSFTEVRGINYVSFSFREGDHAVPGVYSRRSWEDSRNLAIDID